MSEQTVSGEVAHVLTRMADTLDNERPGDTMTNATLICLICLFADGLPDLFDEAFPKLPPLTPHGTRSEYAAELRAVRS